MSGMTSNSPRRIFNKWDDSGLPTGANAIGKLAAGEAHVGEVGLKYVYSNATVVFSTTAYAALDNAGSGVGPYGCLEFVNAARANTGNGVIRGTLFTETGVSEQADYTLILFNKPAGTTHGLDNAAFQLADADVANVVGVVCAGTKTGMEGYADASKAWATVAPSHSIQFVPTAIPFVCATGTSLYGRIRADAAMDCIAKDNMRAKLLIQQS